MPYLDTLYKVYKCGYKLALEADPAIYTLYTLYTLYTEVQSVKFLSQEICHFDSDLVFQIPEGVPRWNAWRARACVPSASQGARCCP